MVTLILALLAVAPVSAAPKNERVKFTTADGEKLVGLFHAPNPGKPTLVLLHGLSAVKEEWTPLFSVLEESGWGYLAYDARGHGDSSRSKGPDGAPDGFKTFGPGGPGSPWMKMVDDVGAALRFLANEKKIDRGTISLGGASLGANVVLTYAALTNSPKAVIALSPGLDYAEIKPDDVLPKLKTPHILIVASRPDAYAFGSSNHFATTYHIPFWFDVRPGHGVQMLDNALLARLMKWLNQNG